MAQWKKIITSGSIADFHHISSSGDITPVTTGGTQLGSISQTFGDLFLKSTGMGASYWLWGAGLHHRRHWKYWSHE